MHYKFILWQVFEESNKAPIFLCLILDIFELADYRQTEIIMVSHETQTFIGLELETVSLAKFNLMNFPIHLILTPLEYV